MVHKPILAVIGDIVLSRAIAQRAEFQKQLRRTLDNINKRSAMASPYTITLGDEFQAVYRDPRGVFVDILTIMERIAPVSARFAIGVGTLRTPINPTQAIGMDGPAF